MVDRPTLEDLDAEALGLGFAAFDAEAAWRLGVRLHERAVADDLKIAIEISDAGHFRFFLSLPGATPDNAEWIRRKRNTVMRFHRSSLAMRLLCERKGTSLASRYGLAEADYVASGGGVPIVLDGTGCVGAIVVSGLPDVEDHRLVVDAMLWLKASGGA